jgi:hypothetical protein
MAMYSFLKLDFKFLCLDIAYKNMFFKNMLFNDSELLRYNIFFSNFSKIFKNQAFLYTYKEFLKVNKVKFVIIFDYEYYSNFVSYLNLLNVSIFSITSFNSSILYSDFFLLFTKKNNFYKIICYSYLLYIMNLVNNEKKMIYQNIFFKKMRNNYISLQRTVYYL